MRIRQYIELAVNGCSCNDCIEGIIQSATDEHDAELATLRAENEMLRDALRNLSTVNCFGNGEALGVNLSQSPVGREVLARMQFAKEALK